MEPLPTSPPLTCPQCSGVLRRTSRHTLDHLLNLFRRRPLRRYRCTSARCHAEICLPAPAASAAVAPSTQSQRSDDCYAGGRVLEASRAAPSDTSPSSLR